mgnify:CR=1 FL=1
MFVALRDLRHARGRFALMLVVIILITFLVTFLSSLTAGLARESSSAITDLPASHLSFSMQEHDAAPEFTGSSVSRAQWEAWSAAPGVLRAEPLGVATTRATSLERTAAVTAFGVLPTSELLPDGEAPVSGTAILSEGAAAALGVGAGGTVSIAGVPLQVTVVIAGDASFSHTPALWLSLEDWQRVGAPGEAGLDADRDADLVATAVAITSEGFTTANITELDATLGTTTVTTTQARMAISSFSSENGSLMTMQAFLIAISALVVGAFFTVWTIGRSGDIAVLKALGASTGYLLRDAIGQAALVLVLGVGLGAGLAAVAATALAQVVPVEVTAVTTALPALALIALGLVGAGVAIARISRIDPHAALAAR